MHKKKFLIDSILNLVSTALPLIVLQLVSLPIAANLLGPDSFGTVITVISILTVIGFPIGNVLSNIRLLRDDIYIKENIEGDFNYILLGSSFISSLIIVITSLVFIDSLDFINIILFVLIVISSIFKEYLIVSYRIMLNFKGILLNNILLSIGYIIGTGLFYLTDRWEFIYLVGLIFSMIYIVMTTNLLSEPLVKTKMFNTTFKEFIILYCSSLLNNLSNYADKIILLPLLGAQNVSIYYAVSILGKIITMIFNPINSVILSYITKIDKIKDKIFLKVFFVGSIIGIVGYFTVVLIGPYFLNFFYPIWAEQSLELIYITSATSIITVLSSIFHPFNLRYSKLKWQFYISGSNLILFLLLAYYLTNWFGLFGFTCAVLISVIYKFIFQIYVYFCNTENKTHI